MGVHSDEYWYLRITTILSFHRENAHRVLNIDTLDTIRSTEYMDW